MKMLDLFCGKFGWGRIFAERGWEVVGIDLVEPSEIPEGCQFIKADIMQVTAAKGRFSIYEDDNGPGTGEELWSFQPDFICASSPCEEFSVHGMKNFHPNPKYPEMGIQLFNHTRALCGASGLPYIMENVRNAQEFVGKAVNHCGPFYLWGSAVPTLLPQGITKGFKLGNGKTARKLKESGDKQALIDYRKKMDCWHSAKSPQRIANTAKVATIPPMLAHCVVEYAEIIISEK